MGTIEELGLNLVRGTYPGSNHEAPHATIFLPEDFPYSAQNLDDTIGTIRNLFGDDAWGSMSAGFTEQDGMGIMFYLPKGKEDEYLEVVRTADLPLGITQPVDDKPQLKLLAVHNIMALIEPSQVITSKQIRDMIRTRPLDVQEVVNGYWRVSLDNGYLKMHTYYKSSGFDVSRLDSLSGVLTPNYPHIAEYVTAYVYTDNEVRTGNIHVRMKFGDHKASLCQDILDDAATPGFTEVASSDGYVTAEYAGPEAMIVHPIDQGTALREIILNFMLKLGIFPVDATLYISLPAELNKKPCAVIKFPFGVISGRYSYLY
jgi:hypothetical protein